MNMELVFLKILNMSFSASLLALAVFTCRLLLKKAPKNAVVLMWALVGVRLACPFSLESPSSLLPVGEVFSADSYYSENGGQQGALPGFVTPADGYLTPMQTWAFFTSILWLAGAAAMLLYGIISWARLKRKLGEAVLLEDNIWLCDHIATPFIFGLFRSRIYLPSNLGEPDRQYALAHEKAHLSRRDHLWKPLAFLLLTVHWFNPVLWISYLFFCRDLELACDEKALRELGGQSKKPYSNALISCAAPRRAALFCPVAFGETGVKSRVKFVLGFRKPALWVTAAALIVCAGLAAGFLTNPKTKLDERLKSRIEYELVNVDAGSIHNVGLYSCAVWRLLGQERRGDEYTLYLWVREGDFHYDEKSGLREETGCNMPMILTMKKEGEDYRLVKRSYPRDGSKYASSIREEFPWYLWTDVFEGTFYDGQEAALEQKAKEHFEIA